MASSFEEFCIGSHEGILHGRASSDSDAIGTFFKSLPRNSEVYPSTNARRFYRWTGEFRTHGGHLAVVLERLDNGDFTMIHTCLSNLWVATGKVL